MDREGEDGQSRDLSATEAQACIELRATLASNLKAARQQLDLSQSAFARKLGVKQNTLSNLEMAKQNTSFPMLARLAVAIGVPAQSLLIPGGMDAVSRPGPAAPVQ